MKIISKLLFFISVLFLSISCGNKSSGDGSISQESLPQEIHSENDFGNNTKSSNYDNAPHIPDRQKAISDAFELGKELGRIDGRKGINDCHTYASAYSDDWIKQAFIQGYEWGLSEVGFDDSESYSGSDDYLEYEEPSYYYDDEDY